MAAKDTEDKKSEDQEADLSLDMSQSAVKKMIAEARERGYITYDQLNNVLPPDQVSSEQIEDVMSMLSEMGINIIEDDEAEEISPGNHKRSRRSRSKKSRAREGEGSDLSFIEDERPRKKSGKRVTI